MMTTIMMMMNSRKTKMIMRMRIRMRTKRILKMLNRYHLYRILKWKRYLTTNTVCHKLGKAFCNIKTQKINNSIKSISIVNNSRQIV